MILKLSNLVWDCLARPKKGMLISLSIDLLMAKFLWKLLHTYYSWGSN